MPDGAKNEVLAGLREKIAGLEKRPALAGCASLSARGGAESLRLLASPPGLVHEVFTDERRNGGAALGFALGQGIGLLTPARPALFFMQMIREAQDGGLPYGAGLESFGLDPARLVLGRVETISQLLWAMEEAIACCAVAGVIADIGGHPKMLDFTASRRLSLRARAAGASVFLLRHGSEREASAAQLRWRVTPVASEAAGFDTHAPGRPRWAVSLEKGRLMGTPFEMIVDWTENGFEKIELPASGNDRQGARAPLPGAGPGALGYRLPQTG